MPINLDLVIDSPENEVDMKSALKTMEGISEASGVISEAVLDENFHQRQTSKRKVRTILMESFKGSYGHRFRVDFDEEKLVKRYRSLGKDTIVELYVYFLHEAMLLDSPALSTRAQKVLDDMEEKSERVVEKLRNGTLKRIHKVAKDFNHEVKLRHRKSRNDKTIITVFNQETSRALSLKEINKTVELEAVISRLNIFTGNGRMVVRGESETVAFGFSGNYKSVKMSTKKILSVNLDQNNAVSADNSTYLRLEAKPVARLDGKIVKYLIQGIT